MATQKSIIANQVRSRILGRTTSPKVSWYVKEDRYFYSKYRTIVFYITGNSESRWTFVDGYFKAVPGFNKGLSLNITKLGDTVLIQYDRTAVSRSPDYLDVSYRIEHRLSGTQSSDRFKAWGAIRKLVTTVFSN